MAARIPDGFIDDLLARTDIVELIQARLPLKRKGKEYLACCPFHNERTPSFTVSPAKQFYHCFGCGANGNALRFLMEYDHLEFLDAVEELASRAGMDIPRNARQHHQHPDRQPLYSILDEAARLFRQELQRSIQAQQYLDRRGVDAHVRERFGIGYAPEGFNTLHDALGTSSRRLALLERAGLVSRNDRGHCYDKFRNRVMFPIFDRRGRVIAFGGRALNPEGGPKYLNSPDTALFHKGRELYGLWQARQTQHEQKHLMVVEGYMDVLALAQHGISRTVATLGTATTSSQVELLFRNAADVVFCFDGDRAGRAAAWKALEAVLSQMRDGRQVWFLFLPEGEDPDSLIRHEGAAGFTSRMDAAIPLSQYFFDHLSDGIALSSLDGKARLVERARPLLNQLPPGAFTDLMQQHLESLTGLPARRSSAMITPFRRAPASHGTATPKRSVVRSVIGLLLQQPSLALHVVPTNRFANLQQPGIGLLTELLELVQSRPGINTGTLLEHFSGRDEHAALCRLAAQPLPGDSAQWPVEFFDALTQLERQTKAQRIAELQDKQRHATLDAGEKTELRDLLRAWR